MLEMYAKCEHKKEKAKTAIQDLHVLQQSYQTLEVEFRSFKLESNSADRKAEKELLTQKIETLEGRVER